MGVQDLRKGGRVGITVAHSCTDSVFFRMTFGGPNRG